MNKKRISIVVLAVVAAGAGLFLMRNGNAAQEVRDAKIRELFAQPRPVKLETVGGEKAVQRFTYPAEIKAGDSVELAFRVGGPLVEVLAVPGDAVEKDAVLLQIDPRDYTDQIAALEAQLKGAQATLAQAAADYERADSLRTDKVISQADFDAASALRDLRQAQVDQLQAALQTARHALADTSLKAPFAGTVTRKYIENYEMVEAGHPVLALLDSTHLDVNIDVPERDMRFHPLHKGMMASVSVSAVTGRTFAASIKEWSADADSATRTYAVTFTMDAPIDVQVLPGMTAEVSWAPKGTADEMLSVPLAAICRNNGGAAVWVYDAGSETAARQPVEIGRQLGADRVEILKGLKVGDTVVTAGANYVQDGMKLLPLVSAREQ